MGTLARECSKPQQLRMQGWLYHLLCFAADASANGEWRLADASLNSLAACLLRGCELPVSRRGAGRWMWGLPDACLECYSLRCNPRLPSGLPPAAALQTEARLMPGCLDCSCRPS